MAIKDKKNEIWMPITGYEGKYEISNWGRIRSLNFYKVGKEKILEHTAKDNGYIKVGLETTEGKLKWYWVHRLVASAFLSHDATTGSEIDHKDGNRQNNYIDCQINEEGEISVTEETSNLRWCTHKQNMNNALTKKKMSNSMRISWQKRKNLLDGCKYS